MFLLKPGKTVNQVFRYCLAYAARRCGIQVHAFVVMSDHFHLVITDTSGRLPEFMHWLDEYVARALNAHRQRWENFWAPGSYSCVSLVTRDDVLDKMVYCLVNPVAAGLVSRAVKWPGLTSIAHGCGDSIEATRPEIFFRPDGELPDSVRLKLYKPPGFKRLTNADFDALLRERVREQEDELRARFRLEGRRFAGVHAIRKIRPFDSPATREPRRRLNPRIACKDPGQRIEALGRLKAFEADYREAYARWRAGKRGAVFPLGTYQLRVQAGVRCRDP